jgi:hypothetical protein
MPTTPTIEPPDTPVRASGTIKPASRPRRRNPASKLMSVLRGDKYMVNAYPPAWRSPAAGNDSLGGELATRPGTTWRGVPAVSQTKER